jgi:hypothetical protein
MGEKVDERGQKKCLEEQQSRRKGGKVKGYVRIGI